MKIEDTIHINTDVTQKVKIWLKWFCTQCEGPAYEKEAKRQLFDFVASSAFVQACGDSSSTTLLHWLMNSFFAQSHELVFWHRKHLRTFDEYVNSVVEQQNSAIKSTNTGTPDIYIKEAFCQRFLFLLYIM